MAETVLLRDLMGTRYLINSLDLRFSRCVEECRDKGLTIDLNGCRFGPTCAFKLNQYYPTVDFCNTEDTWADGILKGNCEASRTTLQEYEPLELDYVTTIDDYIELVNTLEQGAKYKPVFQYSNARAKACLVMLIMARPDIEFDIRGYASDIFGFVRDTWLNVAKHHDSYSEVIAPHIVVISKSDNGQYGHKSYGFCDEQQYILNREVLPTEFGNSQIIDISTEINPDEEWIPTVVKCCNMLSPRVKQTTKEPGKVIEDFLTFR